MSGNVLDRLTQLYHELLQLIGENPLREGLKKTPKRAAQAFQFLTQGYHQDLATIVNGALFPHENEDIVIARNIEFFSLCEHHILPIYGKCHVGYIPNGKVLGLSKMARIVDMFARRLQIQENLTKQIAEAIYSATDAKGVAVIIEATHLCMSMRGVEKQCSTMVTSILLGVLKTDQGLRETFFKSIGK